MKKCFIKCECSTRKEKLIGFTHFYNSLKMIH